MGFVLIACTTILILAGVVNMLVSVANWQKNSKAFLAAGILSTIQSIAAATLWYFMG